ncbi:CCR4-NOT transcription complex subunit 6-like [Echinococcus granulosus]|nr:CCR4-NOT transcription complex subunit 6-like [Echinococcus granulosus]
MPPRPTIYSSDVLNTPTSFPVRRSNNLNEFTMQSRLISEEEARNRARWFRVNLTGPLKNFPRNICYLTYITTLVIKNNNLERLPPELGNLVNLVNLDASYNRLKVLPSTIGELTDLRALILNDNQISDLPLEVARLLNLRLLNLQNNPLSQESAALYGDGTESFVRRLVRHYLDIYSRQLVYSPTDSGMQVLVDSGPPEAKGSQRYRTASDQIACRSRPRSLKWLARQKTDLILDVDYCSSPDSAVATGSESLGSSESIDTLDTRKVEDSRAKSNAPPRRRNNRRYRRWCQMKRDSLGSVALIESSDSCEKFSKIPEAELKIGKAHRPPVPVAVVRNTLERPLVFLPGSYPPDQTTVPSYVSYFPAYSPHWLALPYLLPGDGQFSSLTPGNVTIDLTGHDVSYFVEHLPPLTPKRPQHDKVPPPQPLMEINTNLFQPYLTSERDRAQNCVLFYPQAWSAHPPFVYIPAPLHLPRAQDHCRSLKTCAMPFSEFPNYIGSAPPHRQWRQFGTPSRNGYRLTVMCYNVLSANYATHSQYPYCPSWAIDWEYRRRGILEELRQYEPNIICLQEIDTDQFETVFVPELAKNNYEGVFLPKSRSRTMEPALARKVDGCAIFWLSEKFTKVAEFHHEFMISCSSVADHPSPLLINRVMTRDNVAIGVVLEIKNSGTNGRRFCVTTGHIHWDPEHSDVKLIQAILWTAELWSRLERFNGDCEKPGLGASRMPVILCGDFNSLPDSGVVEYLSTGSVPTTHVEFLNFGFNYHFEDWKLLEKWAYEGNILRHRFNFDRAYRGNANDGMRVTNLTYDFKGMIDYIFFSRNHFRLLGSLDQIPDSWFVEERVLGCPHIHVPSDHFSLLVELDLLGQPGRGLAISDPAESLVPISSAPLVAAASATASTTAPTDTTSMVTNISSTTPTTATLSTASSGAIGSTSTGTTGSTTSASMSGAAASTATASSATNSPKPKGSSGSRQKQGKR